MARPWDRFLTEQDKAFDAQQASVSPKPKRGTRPALLLIDLYRAAFGDFPEPLLEAVKRNGSNLGLSGWEALPHIKRLLVAARNSRIPVIHVTRSVTLGSWEDMGRADRGASVEVMEERRRQAEIVDELTPEPGEIVLSKRGTSAFFGTPLPAILNQLRVDTVIVAGEATSGCVRAAVVDGRNLRFSMMVPEECVFDRTEASHAMNLYDMHRKYAEVLPIEGALAYMQQLTGDSR